MKIGFIGLSHLGLNFLAAAASKKFSGRMKKLKITLAPMGQKQFAAKLKKANANIVRIMKKAGMYQAKAKK